MSGDSFAGGTDRAYLNAAERCEHHESAPKVMVPLDGGLVVQCRFCQGTGSVPDVSQWPPMSVCPGCKGAGVHRV